MDGLRDALKGKKTYLQAAAAALLIGLGLAGFVDSEMVGTGLAVLGVGSVASLGAKIDRANKERAES